MRFWNKSIKNRNIKDTLLILKSNKSKQTKKIKNQSNLDLALVLSKF